MLCNPLQPSTVPNTEQDNQPYCHEICVCFESCGVLNKTLVQIYSLFKKHWSCLSKLRNWNVLFVHHEKSKWELDVGDFSEKLNYFDYLTYFDFELCS